MSAELSENVKEKKIARRELDDYRKAYEQKEKELEELELKFDKLEIENKERNKTIVNLNKKVKRRESTVSRKCEIIKEERKDKLLHQKRIKSLEKINFITGRDNKGY